MKISVILLHIFIIFAHLGSVMHDTFIDEIAIEIEEHQSHDELLTPVKFTIQHSYSSLFKSEISEYNPFNFIRIFLDNEINPPEYIEV